MSGYSAGSVSAKIELNTKDFDNAVKKLKEEVGSLKGELNSIKGMSNLQEQMEKLKKEIETLTTSNNNYKKTIDELRKKNEQLAKGNTKVANSLKEEQKTLDSSIKKTNELVTANNNLEKSNKTTTASITSHNDKLVSSARKASDALTKFHEKNIRNSAKESQEVKRYTMRELKILDELAGLSFKKRHLIPLEYGSTYWDSYTKMRNREKRHLGVGSDYYFGSDIDFSTAFQKRMKELLKDLNISISSKLDGDFKKVKDKLTGKMVEYLDISAIAPFDESYEWIRKEKNKLRDLADFEKEIRYTVGGVRKGKYDFYFKEFKEEMDRMSRRAYHQYGKGGNIYFKDFVRENEFDELYKKSLRELTKGDYYDSAIKRASNAFRTFERGLKTTDVSLMTTKRHLTETGQALKENIALMRESKGLVGDTSSRKASNVLGGKEKLKELATAIKEYGNSAERAAQKDMELETAISNLLIKTELEAQLHPKLNEGYRNWIRNIENVSENAKKATNTLNSLTQTTKVEKTQFEQLVNIVRGASLGLMNFQRGVEITSVAQEKFNQSLNKTKYGAEEYKQRISRIADELKGKWHSLTVELARANAAQYKYWQQSRGSVSGFAEPLPIKGYNDYLRSLEQIKKAMPQINQALERQKQIQAQIKAQQLDQYYAKLGAASTKYWNQIRQGTINLNTYKSNINQINKKLTEQTQRTERLKAAQSQLWSKYHTTNLNTYKANMTEINRKLEEQTTNVRKAGKGLTSFNNGVVQTAHSGRILSNTLYQIRGALLSLKMIFTAMGGMALWGFGMEIMESVKETVTAKNEMEAQLKQNTKVDASGIQYFRKELDKLTKTYKKVNKYTVGETVSSIGLEFNLTAKQMAKALPIVTMIQSEYVRAGRKTSEAALAVKDILQGEFQRLSRETGVGKEELIAYGWDEDKTNIDGLLKALEKAALDRHWDIFATKATSLNDAIEITKSRFSELGANVIDSVTPAIVGGFNMIIDTIANLQNAFDSLSSFWQNSIFFGSGLTSLFAIGTLLPMITKGMGLAEIATIGWRKSLLTAVFNLNKAEVGLYGFRKALAAVITGTKASELATTRTTKAIMGRILGLNQATLAEHGYMTSLVKSKMQMTTYGPLLSDTSIAAMNLRQKIIYLAKGELVADKASATWGKTIKSLITSTKLWRIALVSLTGIGLVAWLSSVAMWTDSVKKRMETYNDVLATGKEQIDEAQKTLDNYNNQLAGMSADDPNYSIIKSNADAAQHNLDSIKLAYNYAKDIKKEAKATSDMHKNWISKDLRKAYESAGVKNEEERSAVYQQIKYAAYDIAHAEEEAYKFRYASEQHINQQLGYMEQANIDEEARVKYITEYATKAEEAAEHLKQFNEGDFTAGIYYILDRISLMWIDLWNNQSFLKFWESLKKTWEDLKPTAYALKDALQGIVETLLQFAATDIGRWITAFGGLALGVGILAYKFRNVLSPLKDLGSVIWDRIKDFKGLKKTAEEASEEIKGTGTTSTGGINGEVGGVKKGKFWETVGQDAKNTGRSMFKYMGYIAAATVLITEAIILLNAPMLALAGTGEVFKRVEPQVKKGIEGLKLIAPTVLALLVPAMALMYVMDRFKVNTSQLTEGFKTSAIGIALAITLVTEAIVLLNAPLLGLAVLGSVYGKIKDSVKQGIEAIKVTDEALKALVTWVPVFIAGIALAAVAFGTGGVGVIAIGAAAVGIAIGIGLVTEAIVAMSLPLEALGEVGANFPDLSNVKQGAEALKVTAEALGYVEDAMRSFVTIKFEELGSLIADVVGLDIGADLTKLSGKGGFFEQLKTFTEEFNKLELTPIDTGKVTTLSESATGLDSVKKALVTVKDALKDLPNFEVDNRSVNQKYQDSVGGQKTTEGISNYFEQLKQPIEQLNTFIKNFNNLEIEPVETGQVEIIQGSANAIGAINSAIENVKTAMGNVVDAQWAANMGSGGIVGAVVGFVAGDGNPNSSGLKSGLDELYLSVKDIMDFNTKISGLTSEGSGDTSSIQGASNMVSALQTEINNLKTTLSTAVPEIKATAKTMGSSIVTGVKEGISTLSTVATDAKTQGKSIATNLNTGFEDELDIKTPTQSEVSGTLTYLDGKKTDFYNKGKALGENLSQGYKDGQDMHSPGIIARSTKEELDRVSGYFDDAQINLPQKAFNLAQSVASNFGNIFGGGNIQLPNMDSFQQALGQVIPMVGNVKTQVSTNFNEMQTNVGNSFNNIVGKTRTSLSNMQTQTTKNITGIKTSWRGMQTALIASAENIRSQTSQKINTLKDNMASFWKKIKNPELLISGSAGGQTGTIKRRYGGSALKMHYAGGGGTISRSQKLFPSVPRSNRSPDDDIGEYLKCLLETGKPCYAGGWNFNWANNIQNRLTGWKTHFGKYHLDDFLNVGKFSNSSFPVRGRADVAKQYIFDVISSTRYDKYFDSKFGEDPVAALRAGAFNCWDGTNIVLALARAFGFSGSRMHGTWNGIGHVWASIPGLGVIDPTAIQNRGTFMATGAVNYGGGTKTPLKSSDVNTGEVHNYNGNINITINTDGRNVEVEERRIDERSAKQILDILGISSATGR